MDTEKKGYVYIFTNPAFREDWVKIGMTEDVFQRVKTLDTTPVPLPFEIYAVMRTCKYKEAESLIHSSIARFTNLRVRDNREFFKVTPETALEIMRDVAKVIVDAEIVLGQDLHESQAEHAQQREMGSLGEKKTWLISSNSKFFDLDGCFKKYGYVYWSQYYKFMPGDTVYIYHTMPDCTIKEKCEVVECELPFSKEIEQMNNEFYVNANDAVLSRKHNRNAKLELKSRTQSKMLEYNLLLDHGLHGAIRGAINLSNSANKELLAYIEENF